MPRRRIAPRSRTANDRATSPAGSSEIRTDTAPNLTTCTRPAIPGTVVGASISHLTRIHRGAHGSTDDSSDTSNTVALVIDDAERHGVRVGIAAFIIWGFLTIYWKQLSAFDAIELIGWRMLAAAIVMAVITTVRGTWPAIVSAFRTRATCGRLVVAALLLTGNWGSYVWAVVNDRVIETALGYFIAPLATMAIGVIVLGERANAAQKIAFACASIGVLILTAGAGRPPWIALVLAATWSLYALSKRNIPLGAIDSLTGETFVLLLPAIAVIIAVSGRDDSAVSMATGMEWTFLLSTGVITAVPLMLFASAAKSIPFTLLGPLNLLVPVINFGLGWALYGEPVSLDRLIGFGFVWAALAVVMTDRIRSTQQQYRRRPAPVA
jgi:chloramphenicol-sensitive protein RarD